MRLVGWLECTITATHYHCLYSKLNFYSSCFISFFPFFLSFFSLHKLRFSSSFSLFLHKIYLLFTVQIPNSFHIEIKIFFRFLISPIKWILTPFYQLEFLPSVSTIHKKKYLYIFCSLLLCFSLMVFVGAAVAFFSLLFHSFCLTHNILFYA